ncbi:uncharacterized protein [Henckelia pumila]|uniref:uncharacterized protein n=1 Tax=Henckelia pumila TaxID=405737 RepID=UPI003C6DF617
MGSLEFSGGRAEITEVTKCLGDAFLITVRNKKRVGYTYELTLKVKGEWHIGGENKKVKGHLDVPEFTFGELDDLQVEVQLSEDKDFKPQEKQQINQDLKSFLKPLQERLLKFEEETQVSIDWRCVGGFGFHRAQVSSSMKGNELQRALGFIRSYLAKVRELG